ncbi:MAG TPA: hypothetical protein H9867_04480 [Candidatus Corynebacterium gallistercoris]|uniref:Uncharacterized protein n=1 Tax=Candidatus Corynebacterium gallistercoris TaxID=2838530 RepID=A0A9D1RY23_9CORY|nr:hypothetical protein [Candidatus Corynebacterium gallistercoris]
MSSSPISDLQDTLLPWASSAEAHLAGQLADTQLFVELPINGDELERLTRFYGTFLSRQLAAGSSAAALLEACPALTIATLLARAARLNEISELPAEYWSGLGVEPTAERVELIEGRYAELLAAAGLDPIDAAATGPDGDLGRLFAHVGIATDWTPELIEVIDTRRMNGEDEPAAADEAAVVVEQFATSETQIGPMCATMPEIPTKLIAPVVDMVRHAAENPDTWEYTLPAAVVESLPPLIQEDVIEELRERPAGTDNRRHSVGVAHREDQPRLQLDVQRRRVVLRLPAQPLEDTPEAEVRWRVDFDGQPGAYRTSRSDNPSRVESEILDIPVRQPVREISVHNTGDGQNWNMPVVATDDPMLVFTVRGANLTGRVSLHHAHVFVVVPEDAVAKDPVTEAEIPVMREIAMKTWPGWVIRLLDLSQSLGLHVYRAGDRQPSMASVRAVDPRQRVQFIEPDEPVAALKTGSGKGIHADSLQVEFPPTVSGAVETWFLSVSAYAGPGQSGEEVSEEEPLEVPAEGGVFDVFDPEAWDSPWVGEYLVRLRGPRNESFRHEYALVEGLSVETEVQGTGSRTRLPVTAGLSPVTVKLLPGEKPFERIRPITIPADERFAMTVVETEAGDALPVVISPARLKYQLSLRGEDPMWRTDPMVISSGWIDTSSRFRIRPGTPIGDPRLVIRNHHGSPVRTLTLQTLDEVTWWVDLSSAASSLSVLTEGTVELEFVDTRRVSVRLARIRPDFEWSAAVEDHHLVISGGTPERVAGLNAWVWPMSAPWLPARVVALGADGRGELPADLIGAGNLSVQLFSPDRFNHLRAPVAAGERSVVVEAEGFYGAGEDPAEVSEDPWVELSGFLAGYRDQLPTDHAVLSTLWDVQAGWLRGRFEVLDKLQEALTHNPRESVHAMSESLVSAADRPAQFIASGLVHSKLTGAAARRSDSPWIAALEILGDLSQTDDEGAESKRLRSELKAVAGAPVAQTVETGRDVSLDTACIDSTTVQIAHMDPAQQKAVLDMFFGGAGVVPGALSEENSRLIAVFETFERRQELSELLGDPELMKTAVTILRKVKSSNRQLYLSARVRFDRLEGVDTDDPANRWALAPVISMIFALATRMYAHGCMSSVAKLKNAYAGWAKMARLVPDLVTGDIVMADAMVLGVFGPQVSQEETEGEAD